MPGRCSCAHGQCNHLWPAAIRQLIFAVQLLALALIGQRLIIALLVCAAAALSRGVLAQAGRWAKQGRAPLFAAAGNSLSSYEDITEA